MFSEIWCTSKGKKCVSEEFLWALGLSSFWQVWFSGSQRADGRRQQVPWPSPDFRSEPHGRVWAVCLLQKPGHLGVLRTAGVRPCPMPAAKRELPLTERKQVFRESSATFAAFILLLINKQSPQVCHQCSCHGCNITTNITELLPRRPIPARTCHLRHFLTRQRRTSVSC